MAFDFGNANEAQRSAISTTDGPLLIIAGPGTGKTYTLVKRIVYLITEKDVLPEEIMIATFTEKAAKELITRITNELYAIGVSVNLNEMYIGTFHSICLRILKDHLEYTRIKKNYRMLDNFDQQYMVFQKINRFRNLPYFDVIFDKKQGAWRQAGEIVKYVNNLAEELVDIDKMQEDSDEHIVAVANIMKQYNILMEDENLIDFSSIQTEAYKLLIEEPSILEEIQQKIKYVMVDEYQDTNYIQELLVFLIAGKNRNICVVGDDDQGLYRFRGATIRNILEFPGHFAEGECKQVKLVTNYRSERQIIDFYNKWMSTTDGRAYDFMWKNFRFEKKIVPPEGKKDAKVGVIKCSGKDLLDDWYEQVYSFITQLKSSGVLTDYNQIAVLCKSVKGDKIIGMVEYLEEHGIKVYSPRSEMFFERKEIKQVIGCMILCFPEYVRKLQQRDFSYDFENLYNYYDTQCIAAARELILQYRDTLGKWIAEKMQKHANLRKDNADYAFTGLLYQLLQFEPFSTYLGIDMKSGVIDERPARNLSILSSILGKYEYLHRIDVFTENNIVESVERFFNMYFRFLFDGGITEYEDDSEYAPSGCVSFMTIHQSKGMEFPIVIVDSLNGTPRSSGNHLLQAKERTGYPTQKPEKLLERIITASTDPGDLVFDCFMGSGTLCAVAGMLNRKYIGADINLGAVQVTTKRLLGLQNNNNFEVYNVNNYDFFRNPVEAKELIIDALGIQKFDSSTVYDGELDGWMVKIMPTNRIATKADLEELKANLPYHTFEKRKEENPNGVVEKIKIICMGHEADLKASLEQELSSYNLEIEIVDILRDKKDLQFKREADANVVKENNQIIIKEFYPMNLLQKLSMQKESVEDWRQLVESIYIDWNYDGQTMRPTICDIPTKDELVSGIYKIPDSAGKIKIKITDLLSESLELEV